jgi:hypothetical protein
MSCVFTVELPGAVLGDSHDHIHAVLKLYDRRFSPGLRKLEHAEPWTPEIEAEFTDLVASGQATEFVSKLHEQDDAGIEDYEEPEEGWARPEIEAYLHDFCRKTFAKEMRAYETLRTLQGTQIPWLYGTVTTPLQGIGSSPMLDQSTEFGTMKGLLLQYVRGPTLSEMPATIPRASWQGIVDQAVRIVYSYSHLGFLNTDVRCDNFVINQAVADGCPGRVMMIDFGMCEFYEKGRSVANWGHKKWFTDEPGAVGAVMKTRLAKLGFELRFTPSLEYMEYGNTWEPPEDEPGNGRESPAGIVSAAGTHSYHAKL